MTTTTLSLLRRSVVASRQQQQQNVATWNRFLVSNESHPPPSSPSSSCQPLYQSQRRWTTTSSSSNNVVDDNKPTITDEDVVAGAVVVEAEEWIRPDRPLAGDRGHSHLMFAQQQDHGNQNDKERGPAMMMEEGQVLEEEEEDDEEEDQDDDYEEVEDDEDMELARIEKELEELERLEQERLTAKPTTPFATPTLSEQPTVDWLQTRRQVFRDEPTSMTDNDAKQQKVVRGELGLPIVKHTLLSSTEITFILTSMGGTHITFLSNAHIHGRMGVGKDGMMIVTATTSYQIRSMAVALIRQLRLRQLEDCGVTGASMGTKRRSFHSDQTWLIVDCGNVEVHIMSPAARQYYALERLWGSNAVGEEDPVLSLDCTDEAAIDRYLDAEHKQQQLQQGSSSSSHGFINSISGGGDASTNNSGNHQSWKEMYAKLQNVAKRKDVVVPINANPPSQRRKKNNMNRWR